MYPVFLKLSGRRVLLVGGGRVAAGKLAGLLADGAHVTVVAPEIRAELLQPGVTVIRRAFEPADLDDVWYVVAAAPHDANEQVLAAAERRCVFVNAVDDPAHASAYAGSVVRRAGVTIAFSTDGRAPALAGLTVGWWIANTYTDSRWKSLARSVGIGSGGTTVVSGDTYRAMRFWLPLLAAAVCAYAGERIAEGIKKAVSSEQ